jgi:hypothetical protein
MLEPKLFGPMLEHQKIVLKGVHEDKSLFRKELLKSMKWLQEGEQAEFRTWVRQNFAKEHPEVLGELINSGH